MIDAAADVNATTPWGDTALSVARANNHSTVVEILQAAGAVDLNQADRRAAAVQQCGHTPVGTVVSFSDFNTYGAANALATAGKVCYEVKLLTSVGPGPQLGWASPAFSCRGGNGAGDDGASWAVDGRRGLLHHNGENDW